MKNIIRIAAVLLMAVLLAGCKKDKGLNVSGIWYLESVETKASIGKTEVEVYLELASSKSFSLYQKLGDGRFRHYEGSWSLAGKVLSGTYSDRKPWGASYDVEMQDGSKTMVLTSRTEKQEVTAYSKVTSIPQEILDSAL